MTIARVYQCPGHGEHAPHQFRYLHHPSVESDPLPRYCPHCSYDSQGEEHTEAVMSPHLGRPIRAVVDNMHRGMEEGAEFRANLAREKFGMDAEDVQNMKETDSLDNLRQGDTSYVPVNNDITQVMAAAPQVTGFQGAAALGASSWVSQGPFPNAGAHAQAAVRKAHSAFTRGTRHAGATTSSLPALETVQPNYRVRVK